MSLLGTPFGHLAFEESLVNHLQDMALLLELQQEVRADVRRQRAEGGGRRPRQDPHPRRQAVRNDQVNFPEERDVSIQGQRQSQLGSVEMLQEEEEDDDEALERLLEAPEVSGLMDSEDSVDWLADK